MGSCMVSPSARPRGMIVTLCSGSAPGRKSATRAWPASWYAMVRFSASLMIIERRSTPMRTLSLAFSKSGISTSFLFCRAASRAASFTRFARSAPEKPGVPADGVDLVHEDDAGRVLLALLEQVAHARGADADEHLDEVGARDREERDIGLAGDGLGQQRFAGAGWPHEQHTLGNLAAQLLELLRILEEVDDLAQLFLRLVDAGHVLEGHLVLLLRDEARAGLAERQRLRAAALHLAHEEDPDADEEQHRHPLQKDRVPRVAVGRLHGDADALVAEHLDEVRIVDDVGALRRRAVAQVVGDEVAADDHGFDATLLDRLQEFREVRRLLPPRLCVGKHSEEEDDDQADDHPQGEVFIDLVHRSQCSTATKVLIGLTRRVTPASRRARRRMEGCDRDRRNRSRSRPRTRWES